MMFRFQREDDLDCCHDDVSFPERIILFAKRENDLAAATRMFRFQNGSSYLPNDIMIWLHFTIHHDRRFPLAGWLPNRLSLLKIKNY